MKYSTFYKRLDCPSLKSKELPDKGNTELTASSHTQKMESRVEGKSYMEANFYSLFKKSSVILRTF